MIRSMNFYYAILVKHLDVHTHTHPSYSPLPPLSISLNRGPDLISLFQPAKASL